jgi:hypothetical protein
MPASLGRLHSDKRKRARLRRLRKGRVRVSKVKDGLFLYLDATALVHKTGCTEAQLKRAELGLYCRAEHKAPRSPSRWRLISCLLTIARSHPAVWKLFELSG